MTKRIDRWQSDDGSVWDTEAKSLERDLLFAQVNVVMAPLGKECEADCSGRPALRKPGTSLRCRLGFHKPKSPPSILDMIEGRFGWPHPLFECVRCGVVGVQ